RVCVEVSPVGRPRGGLSRCLRARGVREPTCADLRAGGDEHEIDAPRVQRRRGQQQPPPAPVPPPQPAPQPAATTPPEDTCKPVPVKPRGSAPGNRHDNCADTWPPNRWLKFSAKVNGKEFDSLSKDADILWEFKTDNFSDYAKSKSFQDFILERMLTEL